MGPSDGIAVDEAIGVLNPTAAPSIEDRPFEEYFEDRPDRIVIPPVDEKPWLSRQGKRIDFARRDAANRLLGLEMSA